MQPEAVDPPAHDAFTRLLLRVLPDPKTLWQEAGPLVDRTVELLVLDDSTLDKPYAKAIDLVTRHWSGKHHAVVHGINLISLQWTDGDRHIPCDYHLYHNANHGLTKNDHFRAMLEAHAREGSPPPASSSTAGIAAWITSSCSAARLAVADSLEVQSPGQPRPSGALRREATSIAPAGLSSPS